MSSKLGQHWIRTHPDGRDYAHVERMQYKSVKLFEWHWSDRNACNDLRAVLPKDSYILARDHPLSEQKQDMWADPVGTGVRHANEWAMKVASGNYHMPTERTFFLGINEPDATHGDRAAIDRYTTAFLDRLRVHGLRGGAFNFSTGHPRTVDGTPNTKADYTVFEGSHQAIVRGKHIAVAHIYGTAKVPCAPGHYDRLKACTWTDVEWVIGEMGADEHVIGGGPHDGYLISMAGHINDYCAWLDDLILGINDARIHSYQVFTYDFSHPWDSFDVRPIRDTLESYQWRHMSVAIPPTPTAPPVTTHLPSIGAPTVPQEAQPVTGIIDPRVAQAILQIESGGRTHGDNGKPIIRFEAHIFNNRVPGASQYFSHDRQKPWTNQQRLVNGQWQPIHTGNQADEWAAYEFARSINPEAAAQSISMGAGQIMGFNHARIGYPSAQAMLKAFESAPVQTVGFLNFFLSDPALVEAMRRKDWFEIAKRYNGAGNANAYADLLEDAYERLG
jgi:hypothetical protein